MVFWVLITPLITSIFVSEREGAAKSYANAGPLPIPEAVNPYLIDTSIKMAKYIKASITNAEENWKLRISSY